MPYVAETPLDNLQSILFSLNVSHIVFKRVSPDLPNTPPPPTFIVAYMQRPPSLELLPLVEAARSWSYSACRKSFQWKPHKTPKIVRVIPRFFDIPPSTSPLYVNFYWSELLLYKLFHALPHEIGCTDLEIVSAWESFRYNYTAWHVDRHPAPP